MTKTIFAQASGLGKAGVAVFRLSGPKSTMALKQLLKGKDIPSEPRKMHLRKLYKPDDGSMIDEAVVVFFPEKQSFTGQEVVEIHAHGSIAVASMITKEILSLDYVRLAEPGEFAKIAFMNGKFDLTSAEGLADLIDAETEMQQQQAIRQFGGHLADIYDDWRSRILELLALTEAFIDFPDEEIPQDIMNDVNSKKAKLIIKMQGHLDDARRGERLRNGIKLAIIGRPNVGKSSLMNFLLARDVAIVSDIAGTTRDVLEGHLNIGGYPIILQDTAGIRSNTQDVIEQEGIKKANETAKEADIVISVLDSPNQEQTFKPGQNQQHLLVYNKSDLWLQQINDNGLSISLKNKVNLDKLLTKITELAAAVASPSTSPQITRERHRINVVQAKEHLANFSLNDELVLAAEELRLAANALCMLTGKIEVEEILGQIFSSFCIGK